MIKPEDIIQVKAFARQDGAFLSLLWIVSFACIIYVQVRLSATCCFLQRPFSWDGG